MTTMEALHDYWNNSRNMENPEIRKNWKTLEKEMEELIPEKKRIEFNDLLSSQCFKMEYQGFLAGFRAAVELFTTVNG